MSKSNCEFTKVCTPGSSRECERIGGPARTGGGGCLCPCHPDGLASPKPDDWKPAPLHRDAIYMLKLLADKHRLVACDEGGDECYFPRCLADGCEAEFEQENSDEPPQKSPPGER